MPKIIDHARRKQEILQKAIELFARQGFQDTSLSQLSEACGVSRPTLYLYYRDKDEIFRYAVKMFTDRLFFAYRETAARRDLSVRNRLKEICRDILEQCRENRDFIISLVDFLFRLRREGREFTEALRRRTIRLSYLINRLVQEGMESGELRSTEPSLIASHLFDLVQAFPFKVALLSEPDLEGTWLLFDQYIEGLGSAGDVPV